MKTVDHEAVIPVEELAPKRRFGSYPDYRDSQLGPAPTPWSLSRIKHVGRIQYGLGEPPERKDDGILFVRATDIYRGVIRTDFIQRVDPEAVPWARAIILKPGDIIVVRSGAYTGDSAIVADLPETAIAGYDMVIRPSKVYPRFLAYVMLSKYMLEGQIHLARTRAAQPHLNAEELGSFSLLLPSISEQRAIAAFLDRETGRIDELIAKKQRLIQLLAEKRTALISHAVTKGLNPDAPMKDSGIEWLGPVPEHWSVKKLRYLCSIQTGDKDTVDAIDDGDYPFFVRSQTVERINSFTFDCEAVLTAGDGVGVGKVFHHYLGRFDVHQRVYVMNRFKGLTGRFLFYFLKEQFYRVALEGSAKSTVDSLRRHMFTDFPVAVPPKDDEARIIVYLDAQTERLDGLVGKVDEAIDKLREYRSALISAAVTGKIDVRKVEFKRSGLAKRLINAGEYLFAKNDAESALTPICNAIDRVAKDIYGQSGRSTYQRFIHERMELITRVMFNGTAILNFHFAIPAIRDGQGGIVAPKETRRGVRLYSFEQIMYHVVRCNLDHECEIDPVLQDGGRGSGQIKMHDDETLQISFDAVAHGLLFAVLSEVDLWSELVGTIYEHVEWKGTPLIDLIGQKKRMHEISKTPAPEATK